MLSKIVKTISVKELIHLVTENVQHTHLNLSYSETFSNIHSLLWHHSMTFTTSQHHSPTFFNICSLLRHQTPTFSNICSLLRHQTPTFSNICSLHRHHSSTFSIICSLLRHHSPAFSNICSLLQHHCLRFSNICSLLHQTPTFSNI